MADAKNDKQDPAATEGAADVTPAEVETPVPVSLAARRRRIEKLRERQELMALLDDFGDGDLDFELLDEDEDEDDGARYVAPEDSEESDDEDAEDGDADDDDDYLDDDFEDEDSP